MRVRVRDLTCVGILALLLGGPGPAAADVTRFDLAGTVTDDTGATDAHAARNAANAAKLHARTRARTRETHFSTGSFA